MANQEHWDILKKGVEAWNAWRKQQPELEPDLVEVDLRDADLRDADLSGAQLMAADLYQANMSGAVLTGANLSGAVLTGANLLAAQLAGSILYGTDLRGAMLNNANLRESSLPRANLTTANLGGADLTGANLDEAYMSGANLLAAQLAGSILYGTDLRGANLSGANLTGADLTSADLTSADLTSADLSAAHLTGARCFATHFVDVDLSEVLGLDDIRHLGPSFIGIDTIYRSKGEIPEVFLHGCGVPKNFITYMHSLTDVAAFEFYSCFISYSTKDQEFADRLYADLQAQGVRCWFAPHDIKGGRKIHEQVDEAIKIYDKLLLILSDASMNSNWVKTEIANAHARETQQNRQMLFPITLAPFERIKGWKLFDADTGIDSAREIREYFIPDFCNWKNHDEYTAVFERLVQDLKAQPGEKAEAQPAP
jgi:uncharacterized protein YjbI with pentapeptide repeats